MKAAGLWCEPSPSEPTAASPSSEADAGDAEPESKGDDSLPKCSHCGSERVRLVYEREKPSWREVLSRESSDCPSWYLETLDLLYKKMLDSLLGPGGWEYWDDADDDLEPLVEGASGRDQKAERVCYQKWFPGLEPSFNFAEASF